MKKLLTIALMVGLLSAYVFAAGPQALTHLINGDVGAVTNTLTFTAMGKNLRIYTSKGDVELITDNYTNSSEQVSFPKFAGTSAIIYEDIFSKNGVVTLKFTADDTNTISLLIYND